MTAVRPLHLILAPSNLGLRPLAPQHEPGTWQAPEALLAAGLEQSVRPAARSDLARPVYVFEAQPGTRWRNGHGIRAFNEVLAGHVADALAEARMPVVVGGDCSILLGCLAGARRSDEIGLVHIDGHSDFRNARNHDFDAEIGAVAGADLALAIGLGDGLLTDWGQQGPLVRDSNVIQIGERESREPDWNWGDIAETAITRLDIFELLEQGTSHALTLARAATMPLAYWVHVDIDVVDQVFLPAVDSPGSPGLDFAQLTALLESLIANRDCIGCDLTIFDPELDPEGIYAHRITEMLDNVF
jgi:arginase